MLIHFKTSIKTSIILLLFTIGASFAYAGNDLPRYLESGSFAKQTFIFADDTISKVTLIENDVTNRKSEIIIPDSLLNKTINFQVNSGISYHRISHFRIDESKKLFIQAWQKEKEVKSLF